MRIMERGQRKNEHYLDMDGFDFVRCNLVEVRKMFLNGGIAV